MESEDKYIGKQIGNYRITEKFDAGSFGRIYRATHIYLPNRIAAIKVLHLTYLGSPQERENFLQEARFLEILKHPNILPIYDLGIDDGFPYIVAEFAPNGSLRDRILRHRPKILPLQETLSILTQVGQALHYVHEQNIVHRDLKPENILFNAKNDPLIADFGIAVFLETTKTKYVNVIGSPLYMPPEQFEGIASRRSDQYALACIAYELLTGQPPFVASHPIALWSKHQTEPPRPLSVINPAVPPHVERAILTALAKKREDRYPDVASFVSDLIETHTPSGSLLKTKRQWIDDGNRLFDLGRYPEALNAFERAIGLDPAFADAYEGKGSVLYQLGRHAEALAAYGQAIDLDPRYAMAYIGKGNVLYYLKRYSEALSFHDQAIQLDPTLTDAYLGKANVLYYLVRFAEALAAYEEVIRRDPNCALAYDGKGWALRQFKRHEEALKAYERAIALDPNNPSSYNGTGRTLYRLGRYEEALPFFERAIQLEPGIALIYEFRADTLSQLKWYEDALVAYDQALNLNPSAATTCNGRGGVLYDLGRYKDALASYDRALQLNPTMAGAHNGRGNVLSDLGRYEEALAAYQQAIQLQPTIGAFYNNKGDALKALGRIEEALQAREMAKKLTTEK